MGPDSATSGSWSESPAVWRPCTLRQWLREFSTAGWSRRSAASGRPSSSSARMWLRCQDAGHENTQRNHDCSHAWMWGMCLSVFMVLVTERCPESESSMTLFLSKQNRLTSNWLELWSRRRPVQSQFGPSIGCGFIVFLVQNGRVCFSAKRPQ